LDKAHSVFVWMMFLLAANTGALLTLLRERIVFRQFRSEVGSFLPPGYDPDRLDYPFLFGFTTPPSWAAALRMHEEQFPQHPARSRWSQFRKLRSVLMVLELFLIAAFIVWAILG
jgi:hypothetical protein